MVTIWSTYGDCHVARLNALTEHGFEVLPFAHCDYDPTYAFFRAKPASLVVVNRGTADQINRARSLVRTWRLLRAHRPDVVLTGGYERAESLAACLYARTSRRKDGGRPVAILMLNNRAEDHPRSPAVELVKSVYLTVFDGFIASGSDSRDYLERLGVPRSRIELGYDCVDNERIATLVAKYRKMVRAEDQIGYFLCIARLVAKKNVPGLVCAYHTYVCGLPESVPPIPLVICGDGPDKGEIEGLIQRLGLRNLVSLVGEATGIKGVARQLAGCKALVLASTRDETWGLVVNEAMAAGCPVLVARQCGCARDLVEQGVNGFTFDGDDPAELAGRLMWVHDNNDSLEAMGRKSKEIVSRFTPTRFAKMASKLAASSRGPAENAPIAAVQAPKAARIKGSGSVARVVTIWSAYGDYHVARLNALAEHGFEVVPFAHSDYDPTYAFFRAKPAALVVVNRGSGDQINRAQSLIRTWRLLRGHRPDIVLTSGYERSESLAASLYARTSRRNDGSRPVVILMVENRAQDHPRSQMVELVKSKYLRVFDGFLAGGSDHRDYLEHLGVPHSRIELGYDCVDNEKIASLVAQHRSMTQGEHQGIRYFLCIARLVARKNIPGVIRAYHSYIRLLPQYLPPTRLVICGDGPERGVIQDLIERLDLENSVSLVGEVSGVEAVAKQLAGCKALVLASTWDETWGLVVNEAMAAGCPVLVSKQCGCARDLVEEGANGFTFDGHDSDELARHMLWLHTNENLLEAMGRKSMEIVSRFTPARFAASASKLAVSASESIEKAPSR